MARSILIRGARVLTLTGPPGPRRGPDLGRLSALRATDVLVEDDRIVDLGYNLSAPARATIIDAADRVLMPGFVDCHTHACWEGSRLDEWELQRRGIPYLEILAKGGGIHSTVNAVRAASECELAFRTEERLSVALQGGTTTMEIKSGYGLTLSAELKMLRAIHHAADRWPGTVVATALLGHAVEGGADAFVRRTIEEVLPAVSREFPGIAVDAYCEKGAWPVAACERLLAEALQRGHSLRVHTDQFNSLGMIPVALRLGVRSADHLEAASVTDLVTLARSSAIGVILPCSAFHTHTAYAKGRFFVDAGGALAIATNFNPGTAPTSSMPFAIALAVRECGLTPAEAIVASTVNAAAVLGFADRGTIEIGKRADLIILRHADERMLAYEVGGNPVHTVICAGKVVGHEGLTRETRSEPR